VWVPELADRETAPQVYPPPAGFCPHSLHERAIAMRILATSASGADDNGNGYGEILSFGPEGEFMGPFSSDPRIADPRGLSLHPSGALVYLNSGDDRIVALDLHGYVVRDSGRIHGLDPGGGEFGPDGRYYVTMRRQRTIRAMPAALDKEGEFLLPEGIVPFPRGFGFGPDYRLYLASGVAPSGKGDNTIVVFDRSGTVRTPRLVTDPKLSPLDLKFAPNGNIVVASEWPFGAPDAVTTVREYDTTTGQLVRVLAPERSVGFRRPRGLRFGPGGLLYCAGEDHVVAFDFRTGSFAGPVVQLARLNGQALVLVP
jgi:DNA-binding beta-propeller fold protein YncE